MSLTFNRASACRCYVSNSDKVAGYGATCDAHHITAPAPDGNGLARAIGASMKMGGIEAEVCCVRRMYVLIVPSVPRPTVFPLHMTTVH